jgi:predicted Rossmann fold nucleotide-binding protein DprA/Smf involved in DNA uptake
MGRNKYIYALADRALVISATEGHGGTWNGAIEALEKLPDVPLFIRVRGKIPDGNHKLLEKGAKPYPFPSISEEPVPEPIAPTAPPEVTTPMTAYDAVLPVMLRYLNEPKDLKSLATLLDIGQAQLREWLKRSIEEGKVKKNKRPATYEINRPVSLPLLELTK